MKLFSCILKTILLIFIGFILGQYLFSTNTIRLFDITNDINILENDEKNSIVTEGEDKEVELEGNTEIVKTNLINSSLGYYLNYPADFEYTKEGETEKFKINDFELKVKYHKDKSINDIKNIEDFEDIKLNNYNSKYIIEVEENIKEYFFITSNKDLYEIILEYPLEYTEGYASSIKQLLNTFKIK